MAKNLGKLKPKSGEIRHFPWIAKQEGSGLKKEAGTIYNQHVQAVFWVFSSHSFFFSVKNSPTTTTVPSACMPPSICRVVFRLLPCFFLFVPVRTCAIMQVFWLGGWDSRSALEPNMCVVCCVGIIGVRHTQNQLFKAWVFFFIFVWVSNR